MPQLDFFSINIQYWILGSQIIIIYFWGAYLILPLILRNIILRNAYFSRQTRALKARMKNISSTKGLFNTYYKKKRKAGFLISYKEKCHINNYLLDDFFYTMVSYAYVTHEFFTYGRRLARIYYSLDWQLKLSLLDQFFKNISIPFNIYKYPIYIFTFMNLIFFLKTQFSTK